MNCLIVDDDPMSRKVLEMFIDKVDLIKNSFSFSSAIEAINFLEKEGNNIDLIFLDIEMPEMTGMEFIKTLRDTPDIVVVSSKETYALRAFELDVTDYLLKPVSYSRFYKAVDKVHKKRTASQKLNDSPPKEEIFIKNNSNLVRVKYDDIYWIEALENYIVLNTFDNRYTIHFTMKAIMDKLPSYKFMRIHRSYIVNINRIDVIKSTSVQLTTDEGKKSLPVGKSYKDQLLSKINLMNG